MYLYIYIFRKLRYLYSIMKTIFIIDCKINLQSIFLLDVKNNIIYISKIHL